MRAGLRSIQTALRGARYETAFIQTQVIVEQLHSLRTRARFEGNDRHIAIQAIVAQIAKLRNRLEEKIAIPSVQLSVPKANNMLSELGGVLRSWTEVLRFAINEEET